MNRKIIYYSNKNQIFITLNKKQREKRQIGKTITMIYYFLKYNQSKTTKSCLIVDSHEIKSNIMRQIDVFLKMKIIKNVEFTCSNYYEKDILVITDIYNDNIGYIDKTRNYEVIFDDVEFLAFNHFPRNIPIHIISIDHDVVSNFNFVKNIKMEGT